MIKVKDFKKIDLRAAIILKVENIEGSDKLLRLEIDIGEEKPRQIIAGIAKFYSLESLLNRQIIVVVNLEPRQIMGFESRGMLLAGKDGEKIILASLDGQIKPGSMIS